MNNLPLVSIVLAVFNGENFLRDQLNSMVLQSYLNMEIIAVDDASTDSSLSILQEFSEAYPSIAVFPLAQNGGHVAALEHGLRLAKGDFIAISDQDDVWLPTKIYRLLEHLDGAAAIFSDSLLIDANGASLNKTLVKGHHGIEPESIYYDPIPFIWRNIVSGHALLFKKELIRTLLPFAKHVMYDQQIAIASAIAGGIRFLDEALVLHRQHEGNTTNKLLYKVVSTRLREPLGVRRSKKAAEFSIYMDCAINLFRQEKAGCTYLDDKCYRQLNRLRQAFGKAGFYAFFVRLSGLLNIRDRMFYSLDRNKRIKKSLGLALGGGYG